MKRVSNTILLVDDDENDLLFLERAFAALGVSCKVRAVHDGEQALEYLRGEGAYARRDQYEFPSFIIADLKMVHGDGLTLLQTIEDQPEWCIVPYVIFSSSIDPDDIRAAYELGAKSYIVKPGSLQELKSFAKIFYDYWSMCEVPEIDINGKALPTERRGKIAEGLRSRPPGNAVEG